MRLLLDTHTWLWWVGGDDVSPEASEAIGDARIDALVSAASVWEAAIKHALGRLELPGDELPDLDDDGFGSLPISVEHAVLAGSLPPHHRDPFDRMLVAQAQVEDLTIVTRDERLRAYDVPVLVA